eukprot:6190248-Ditylum_brightwellii.AAC.1
MAGLIHTSGSAGHDVNPKCLIHSLRWLRKSFPADFPQFRALLMSDHLPTFSSPNSAPHTMKCFCDDGA